MITRRRFAIAAAGAAAAACVPAASRQTVDDLESKLAKLSYNTASGGGVNLKMMPDVGTGQPSVPLAEVFSFDRYHAICRVDTNPLAFKMPTYKMGDVVIGPNAFFMAMTATTIDQFKVTHDADGKRRLLMRGGLGCSTEVAQGSVKIGSRTAAEHATFEVEAVDGGIGGAAAGDSFAYTAFFDEKEAPVNFAIFGPKATFTGTLVEGEVTIVDPANP
ncbi:MAG TPA: hypothetical protein VGS17_04905 [Candidatus Limnocylindria bacterium]|nr:hypothetical protein [Candidatus Limnocylindria bacterium]